MPWYSFTPSGSLPFDAGDLNNYTLVGANPPSCPNPNNFLCAIQANDNQGHPILTLALALEMATAINNRIDTTNVKLRPTIT